jgi:DNA topoisomerase-1
MDNKIRGNIARYWLYMQFGGQYKWKTFSHNGVMFPPEYEPSGTPIIYKNEEIRLDPENEEIAFLYARYIKSEYVTNSVFNKNFWKDWKAVLGRDHKIQSLDGCDFTLMYNYLQDMRDRYNNKELKENLKKERLTEEEKYKTAMVDGQVQPVGNFMIEPPGIFMGRGKNPNLGKIKKRIYPEDITINIGRDEVAPTPLSGHKWKNIVHDRDSVWIASWRDTIMGKTKYVWLGSSSSFKTDSDRSKFDLAKKLKRKIKSIREVNDKNLHSDLDSMRQLATVLYFIDKLALRIGNEKGEDEADTVGITSLRVEHIMLNGNSEITLDFLGKDSIRYYNKVRVDMIVYSNLAEFTKNKSGYDNIFDMVSSADVNKYLQEFMKDLTAKVFRTYNASYMFQKELKKITNKYEGKDIKKSVILDEFSKANAKIAGIMNHRKGVGKGHKEQINKISESIAKIRAQLKKAKELKKDKKKIEELEEKLEAKKSKKDIRLMLKDLSLETSKANYIDPRITVAFLKKHDITVDKVFSSALRNKFKWAFDADVDYKF